MIAPRLPRSHRIRLLDQPSFENALLIDMRCLPMVEYMNQAGILIDDLKLMELDESLEIKQAEVLSQIRAIAGRDINPGSGDQIADLLFKTLGLEPIRMTKTRKRAAVDEDSLVYLRPLHPVVDLVLDYREIDKLRGTYIWPLIEKRGPDRRIRTTLSMTMARTGRLSSENPNLQNIPVRTESGRAIRSAFVASPGCVLASIDLAQIEMVVAAHDSEDPTMREVFRLGQDIHIKTACAIFGLVFEVVTKLCELVGLGQATADEAAWLKNFWQTQRLPSKQLGFAVLYGTTPPGLQSQILQVGGPLISVEDCGVYIERWFDTYSGIRTMMEEIVAQAIRYGMTWNMFGRMRLIPGARSAVPRVRAEALRQAGNHPIQSGAGDILKVGMGETWELVTDIQQSFPGEICRPLLQIHDELLFELSHPIADDFCGMTKGIMETCVPLDVPVRAEIKMGDNWRDLK